MGKGSRQRQEKKRGAYADNWEKLWGKKKPKKKEETEDAGWGSTADAVLQSDDPSLD